MTDKFCIVLYCFLSFIVISSFFYSYILQKQRNIFQPSDPDGNSCGYGNAFNYSYIYFPVPFAQTINKAVCINKCPSSSSDIIDCLFNSLVTNCQFNMTDHFNRSNQFIIYETTANNFLSMCQPNSQILLDAINSQINTYSLLMNVEEIYEAWAIILVCCPLISILLVVLYVVVITKITDMRYIFMCFIAIFIISLLAFSFYSFTTSAKRIFRYMPYLGIVVFIITVILISTLIYCRKFVERSLVLINMGVQYVRQNRSLIFMSLILFLIWAVIFALQVIALIFIYSINSGNKDITDGNQYQFAYFVSIQNEIFVKILIGLSIIHYFWTNLILYHMGQYICISAGTFWILQIKHNFINSLFTLLTFHLGSVIFGSLVISFVGKITQILYFIMPNIHGKLGCLCCCYCPSWSACYRKECFQKCMGIYTDLSYIQVVIRGEDFITAGRQITAILIDNLIYVQRAYRLARVIVFISKILVALTTTLICYIIMELSSNMKGYFLTNVIIFVFSAFLTSFAFQSYDRSFEVILITILIESNQKISNDRCVNIIDDETCKEILYNKVLAWFQEEKQQQIRHLKKKKTRK